MIRVGIVGASGYTGFELIKILLSHPQARISYLARRDAAGGNIDEIFPVLKGVLRKECGKIDIRKIQNDTDFVFLALPHTVSMDYIPAILKSGKRVVDLGADYRMSDHKLYSRFYGVTHKDRSNLKKAVYGLTELHREKIRNAVLVANPGCYPTASILSLAPLLSLGIVDHSSLIIDAKSGVSGAGKKVAAEYLFSECNENFRAYKVGLHQHAPEIDQYLSRLASKAVSVTFVPHLLPLTRGIFITAYAQLNRRTESESLCGIYKRFYKKEPFLRVLEGNCLPELKNVQNTNFCDVCLRVCGRTAVVMCAIDNLIKGAAGQAVQNMNVMCGFHETEGLLP